MTDSADLSELERSNEISSSSLAPESPCVGRCSTTYGDDICKGCGRTFLEVVNWIIFDDDEKSAVWARLKNDEQ